MEKVKWLSEVDDCNICKSNLSAFKTFIDGKTTFGPWALMCPPCFKKVGCGLGTGSGQEFDFATREKVAG